MANKVVYKKQQGNSNYWAKKCLSILVHVKPTRVWYRYFKIPQYFWISVYCAPLGVRNN